MRQFHYQLIILGNLKEAAYRLIKDTFFSSLKDLKIDSKFVKIVTKSNFNDYSNSEPAFAFYFSDSKNKDNDKNNLLTLISNCTPIYPIVFSKQNFESIVPDCIAQYNGAVFDKNKVNLYVNYALESLGLLRKKRKLFISYHRSESTTVANQLFDYLTRMNYDVFVDSYDVRGADDFQEELLHRMSDSDVLIQLNTEEFKSSKWCRTEIENANLMQIGIIDVVWPNCKLDNWAELTAPIFLEHSDFRRNNFSHKNSSLKKLSQRKIAEEVESVRARNHAARQNNLVTDFYNLAKNNNKEIVRELFFLKEIKREKIVTTQNGSRSKKLF